jgi:N utilization substance protein B
MATYWRRIVRERVLQALYAYELSKEPIADVAKNILGELKKHKNDFEFARELLLAVVQHQERLDTFIKSKTSNWQFDRIAVIDMLLLRMGICEFLYFPDIPPKVTINEVIEIAKIFSTDKSGQFLNGILDAVLQEFRKNDLLKKSGRGLVNESTSPVSEQVKKK